jgi:hypothetical protein
MAASVRAAGRSTDGRGSGTLNGLHCAIDFPARPVMSPLHHGLPADAVISTLIIHHPSSIIHHPSSINPPRIENR